MFVWLWCRQHSAKFAVTYLVLLSFDRHLSHFHGCRFEVARYGHAQGDGKRAFYK
jgi:hypothetical protein